MQHRMLEPTLNLPIPGLYDSDWIMDQLMAYVAVSGCNGTASPESRRSLSTNGSQLVRRIVQLKL